VPTTGFVEAVEPGGEQHYLKQTWGSERHLIHDWAAVAVNEQCSRLHLGEPIGVADGVRLGRRRVYRQVVRLSQQRVQIKLPHAVEVCEAYRSVARMRAGPKPRMRVANALPIFPRPMIPTVWPRCAEQFPGIRRLTVDSKRFYRTAGLQSPW
jgi:hypothetical protein